jgi:hypothetical protein
MVRAASELVEVGLPVLWPHRAGMRAEHASGSRPRALERHYPVRWHGHRGARLRTGDQHGEGALRGGSADFKWD